MKKVTPKMINKANALFWEYIALLENSDPSDEERALLIAYQAIAHRIKQLDALKGTEISAKVRRASVAERNQRWRGAHASGKTPKQIYLDQPKGRGKKNVGLSTINRVLRSPRTP
jgi:hypothetical protein